MTLGAFDPVLQGATSATISKLLQRVENCRHYTVFPKSFWSSKTASPLTMTSLNTLLQCLEDKANLYTCRVSYKKTICDLQVWATFRTSKWHWLCWCICEGGLTVWQLHSWRDQGKPFMFHPKVFCVYMSSRERVFSVHTPSALFCAAGDFSTVHRVNKNSRSWGCDQTYMWGVPVPWR